MKIDDGSKDKKKIYITGAAGFLGSHLADRFLDKGHKVSGCDNMIGGYEDNINHRVDFIQTDCKFLNTMKKQIAGHDIVYHCAATAYEGLSVFSPHLVTENIVQASVSTITAAIDAGVKRFVYCSSMARYGAQEVPFTEDMKPKPEDPYGIGKVCGEQLLKCLAEAHGMEFVIAVPHNIVGPRQKYDNPYRNVASIFANLMMQKRQPVIYGDGEQKRCFSFVQDVLNPMEKLAFRDNVVGKVINVGPDEEFITINELAYKIGDILNFNVKPIHMADRPKEVKLATCSANRARKLLGYNTQISLTDGLKQIIGYIRNRGVRPFRYHLALEIINDQTPRTWKDRLF